MKIYVIHYSKLRHRKTQLERQFRNLSLGSLCSEVIWLDQYDRDKISEADWSAAISPQFDCHLRGGQAASVVAHQAAYKAIAEGTEAGLILEDDILLRHDFIRVIQNCLARTPPEWDLIYLAEGCDLHATPNSGHQIDNQHWLSEMKRTRCGSCYLVSSKAARWIMANMPPWKQVCDAALNKMSGTLAIFWLEPTIAAESSDFAIDNCCYEPKQSYDAVVLGGHGFIGSHLVNALRAEGKQVLVVDLFPNKSLYSETYDLRDPMDVARVIPEGVAEVYQLAACVGGIDFIEGNNDFQIIQDSTRINLNVAAECVAKNVGRVFFASSSCVYGSGVHQESKVPEPTNNYGREKLYAESIWLTALGSKARIGRLHNVFGGSTHGVVADLRRKILAGGNYLEIWGGEQQRSFIHISQAVEGILRLMRSSVEGPVNIGSNQLVSIENLAKMMLTAAVSHKMKIKSVKGPQGILKSASDNSLCWTLLNWVPMPMNEADLCREFESDCIKI